MINAIFILLCAVFVGLMSIMILLCEVRDKVRRLTDSMEEELTERRDKRMRE